MCLFLNDFLFVDVKINLFIFLTSNGDVVNITIWSTVICIESLSFDPLA